MKRKLLKALVICWILFLLIDSGLYIFGNFECIDALFKLLGDKPILRWIIIAVSVALLVKFDAIFDYAFGSSDRRKYK